MPQSIDTQRSRRTPKACDVCRHKKIKCNGETPCQNCSTHSADCTYEFVSMRKKVNDSYSNASNAKLKDTNSAAVGSGNMSKDKKSHSSISVNSMNAKEVAASSVSDSYLSKPSLRRRRVNSVNDSHISKKRNVPQIKKPETDVESRLNKMEMMMEFIVNKLSDNTYKPVDSKNSKLLAYDESSPSSIYGGSDGKEDESYNEESETSRRKHNHISNTKSPQMMESRSAAMNMTPLSTNSTMSLQDKASLLEDKKKTSGELQDEIQIIVSNSENYKKQQFFFPHLSFSLFSNIGIRWLGSQLKSSESLIVLKRLLSTAMVSEKDLLASWSEPIDKSRVNPFGDRGTISLLMNYLSCMITEYSSKRIKKLFQDYYDGDQGLIPVRQFKHSEFLLMNTSLLMSIIIASESLELESKGDFKREELDAMQKQYFTNALYYLHFCSVVNEDLHSIEAIMQLAWYADLIQMPQVSFTLTSIAVRQVQASNMNRAEIYTNGSEEDEFKMRLFWKCYILDKEVSMKTGKPPILNDFDISTPAPSAFRHCWSLNPDPRTGIHPRESKADLIGAYLTATLADDNKLDEFDLYMDLELSAIVSRSHSLLFHATAFLGKTEDQVYARIIGLLNHLECFRRVIPAAVRPPSTGLDFSHLDRLLKIAELTENGTDLSKPIRLFHSLLTFYLRFYYIQLSICNVLMNCNWYRDYQGFKKDQSHVNEKDVSRVKELEKMGLHAARAILLVARKIDARSIYGSNYCLYFPFSGFITLFSNCMQSPSSEYIKSDVQLLIDSTRTFFTRFYVGNQHFEEKWNLVRGAVKFLLYLVVTTVSEQMNITFEVSDVFEDDSCLFEREETDAASANEHSKPIYGFANKTDQHDLGSPVGTPNSFPSPINYSAMSDFNSFKDGVSGGLPISNSRGQGVMPDMLPLGSSANNTGGFSNHAINTSTNNFKPSLSPEISVVVNNESQMNMSSQIDPFDSLSYLDSYFGDMALQSFFNMPQALLDLDQGPNNLNYYNPGSGLGAATTTNNNTNHHNHHHNNNNGSNNHNNNIRDPHVQNNSNP